MRVCLGMSHSLSRSPFPLPPSGPRSPPHTHITTADFLFFLISHACFHHIISPETLLDRDKRATGEGRGDKEIKFEKKFAKRKLDQGNQETKLILQFTHNLFTSKFNNSKIVIFAHTHTKGVACYDNILLAKGNIWP